jgi:chemotaxis protein MotB
MVLGRFTMVLAAALLCSGCVSKGVHTQTLAELEATRLAAEAAKKRSAAELEALKSQSTAEMDAIKNRSAAEVEALKQQAAADIERLQNEKSQLGEEIAKLQQQASEESARATALESERDQEIAKLRELTADHEAVTAKLAALTEELVGLKHRGEQLTAEYQTAEAKLAAATNELGSQKHRVQQLTSSLAAVTEEAARVKQETEAATEEVHKQQEALRAAEQALEKSRQEQVALQTQFEKEQTEKEREIQRLTQTQVDLSKTLQSEIAKGEIRIQQVADRLTINMVDRVLFDSGQGQVRPAGLKVLKRVSDILKTVADKQIRIEGHTDNMPIRGRLKERFPTNWELSTMRATSVVRYLVDQGGVDPANISAVGYADMRPIALNDTEEGRSANRRIEIVLYPKDLKQIVQSAIETSSSATVRTQ